MKFKNKYLLSMKDEIPVVQTVVNNYLSELKGGPNSSVVFESNISLKDNHNILFGNFRALTDDIFYYSFITNILFVCFLNTFFVIAQSSWLW